MRENFLKILESQNSINGRYTNLKRIGPSGGDGCFSILLCAEDNVSKQIVALKFYDPTKTSDAYRVACFERESKVLKLLQGTDHILKLIDEAKDFPFQIVDKQTGLPFAIPFKFIAVELARFSLFDFIYQHKSSTALRNLKVFGEICKGVRRVHAHGICHRDLKPDNCLFMGSGKLAISDFGTARVLNGSIPSPQVNYQAPVGDMRYSAPELLCGLDGTGVFQYRADVYSIGAILFELFTKTTLHSYLEGTFRKLRGQFAAIPPQNRNQVFDGVIDAVAGSSRLPSINSCSAGVNIPSCITVRLDRLYKSLACIDYRSRSISWDSVFNQLSIMSIILRNDIKRNHHMTYRRLIRERRELDKALARRLQADNA